MPKKKPDMSFGWFSGPEKCSCCGNTGLFEMHAFLGGPMPCLCVYGDQFRKPPKPPASGGSQQLAS